jgi:hypothetical protein
MKTKGYRGFASKAAYEAHYSDERNYADEIPAMKAYTKEAEEQMAEGPAPIELLRRLEAACEGEPIDEIIFCCGLMVGQLVTLLADPEDYDDVIAGYLIAIRAGLKAPPTEH